MSQTDLYRRGAFVFIDNGTRRLFFREESITAVSGSPDGSTPELCSIRLADDGSWVFDVPISWKRLTAFLAEENRG